MPDIATIYIEFCYKNIGIGAIFTLTHTAEYTPSILCYVVVIVGYPEAFSFLHFYGN